MNAFSEDFSLFWLAATILLLVGFGLLKLGMAASEMVKSKDGKLEIMSVTEGLEPLPDDEAHLGVKYDKHRLNQEKYASVLNVLSYVALTLSLLCLIIFVITLA